MVLNESTVTALTLGTKWQYLLTEIIKLVLSNLDMPTSGKKTVSVLVIRVPLSRVSFKLPTRVLH